MRPLWLGFFALDGRLAGIVAKAREPVLAQLRLAWWRERFAEPATRWPKGEPLLASLTAWDDERAALVALVDGWEALLAEPPLTAAAAEEFASGRGRMAAAIARLAGAQPTAAIAERLGADWALTDLAEHVRDPEERTTVIGLVTQRPARARLPRSLRPLAILHGLAWRRLRRADLAHRPTDAIAAIRLGLFGR
ncbi:MAG: hypothetical protein JF593_04640 [Novosphingobium sp.]|nr:hypothetical protein [Novosphingobium sp.]